MSDEMEELRQKYWPGASEDLYDALAKCLVEKCGNVSLRHRYLVDENYNPKKNAWYNETAADREQDALGLRKQKKWKEYVYAHRKELYPEILEEIKAEAPAVKWRQTVREAWFYSDVTWPNTEAWVRIFSDRDRIKMLSNPKERLRFKGEPDPLHVYRGCLPGHQDGMSWSLDFESAAHFKRAAGHKGVIYYGTVKKDDVFAYIEPNREEFEVIVVPSKVADIEVVS